jgi:hypothetical protein
MNVNSAPVLANETNICSIAVYNLYPILQEARIGYLCPSWLGSIGIGGQTISDYVLLLTTVIFVLCYSIQRLPSICSSKDRTLRE